MNDPEQKVADHALCCDASRKRKRVFDMSIRRPDCLKHDGDTLGTVGPLNAKPEHGEDASRHDAEVTKVVAESGPDNDGEGNVESCSDGTVEYHWNCDARSADNHDGNGITPVQTDSNNARCCFPRPQIDGISRPICHPSPQSPSLVFPWDRVHVGVGPDIWRGKGRLLLGEFPRLDRSTSCLDSLCAVELDHLGGCQDRA